MATPTPKPEPDPMPPDALLAGVMLVVSHLSARVMGRTVNFLVARDVKRPSDGRIFIQCWYESPCTVTGEPKIWKGRKWYLSDHMTDDEVVKTCFAAFKATVEHEVMEGFHFGDRRVFNPHASYLALMEAGVQEVYRAAEH